ncbi:MAG: hypothetical protein C0611_03330, partial [Desulfobacteraceae bacterium]
MGVIAQLWLKVLLNDHSWNSQFIFTISKAKNLPVRSIYPIGLPVAGWFLAIVSHAPGIPA